MRRFALSIALMASCGSPQQTTESAPLENRSGVEATVDQRPATWWIGRWEDGTGYWLEISTDAEGSLVFTRSGSQTELEFLELSDDGNELIYTELGGDVSYRHTLLRLDDDRISDEWFDLQTNEVWDTAVMTRSRR